MNKDLLNEKEKEEIKSDVKAAFDKKKPPVVTNTFKNSKLFIALTIVLILFFTVLMIVWYITNDPRL